MQFDGPVNRQHSRKSLAALAAEAGAQVRHSHCLRSVSHSFHSTDTPTILMPQYLKTNSHSGNLKQSTMNIKGPKKVESHSGGEVHDGVNKASSGTLEKPPLELKDDSRAIEIGSTLPPPKNVEGKHGETNTSSPPLKQKPQLNGIPKNDDHDKTEDAISLKDVMLKLNALTQAVGKIDSMDRDIDNIADDIKTIKALQETTAILSQDMAEVKETTAKVSQDILEVQENAAQLHSSLKGLEEREAETLSNQQLLAKELLDFKSDMAKELQDIKSSKSAHDNPKQKESDPWVEFELLKVKADQLKNNLILEGVRESQSDRDSATYNQVKSFIKEVIGKSYIEIDSAYRLGPPRAASAPPRPIFIRFTRRGDRMDVWHARSRLIDHPEGNFTFKEDLPPKLRPIMAAFNRVALMAKKYPRKYGNVFIRDYQLFINGKGYGVEDLEKLPTDIRPSFISTPGNVRVVVFFGKDSRFSNHYHSRFTIDGTTFSTMEQYLALHRSRFAGRHDLGELVMESEDPIEAKKVLNLLRGTQGKDEWEKERRDILFAGLLAKFAQNDDLRSYLLSSENRVLGEASKNQAWGIGLTLADNRRLNPRFWKGENLQGKTLMDVRSFIRGNLLQPTPNVQTQVASASHNDVSISNHDNSTSNHDNADSTHPKDPHHEIISNQNGESSQAPMPQKELLANQNSDSA